MKINVINGAVEIDPTIIAQILGDVPGRVDKLDTCVEKLKRNIDGLVELNVALLGRMKALEHHSHLICTGDQNNEDAWHQTNEPMTTGGGSAAGIDPCPTRPAAQQPAQPVAAHAYTRDSEDTGDCAECGHGMADSVHVDAFPEVTAGMEAIMRGDPEPATDSPAKMRSVASALSYNGAPKEASAKHLLLWGAMRIEALERAQRKATAADGGAGEAIRAISDLLASKSHKCSTYAQDAAEILAAIRAGKVPGIATTDERWQGTILASIEMAYAALDAPIGDPDDRDPAYIGEAVVKQLDAERRLLAAVRQELTAMTVVAQGWRRDAESMEKERDEAQGLIRLMSFFGRVLSARR